MQTSISMKMDTARAGQDAEASTRRVRTLAAEGGRIPFGYGIVPGTNKEKQGKLPTSNVQKFAGVAMLTHAIESASGTDVPGYAEKDAMNVMVEGAVWVVLEPSSTAAADDTLYLVPSGANAGRFSKNANDGGGTPVAYITTGLKVRRVFTETDPTSRILAEAVFTETAS